MGTFKSYLNEAKAGEHTHIAHCQVCGRQHALHNTKHEIAKHGYTIQGSHIGERWFAGQCYGSHHKPLEHSHEITDQVIHSMHEQHKHHKNEAEMLRTHQTHPKTAHSGKYKEVQKTDRHGFTYTENEREMVPFHTAPHSMQEQERKHQVGWHERHAQSALDHATHLEHLKATIHGKPPIPRHQPKVEVPKATVDYHTGKVTGTFKTKSERSEHLSHINHLFSKKIDELQSHYLRIPHEHRTEAQSKVYYAPMYPHEWKPRHSAAALKEFPAAKDTVADLERLVAARKAVKEAP